MIVAELITTIEARGNLRTEMAQADQAVQNLSRHTNQAETDVRQLSGSFEPAFRREAQQASEAVRDISTDSQRARSDIRQLSGSFEPAARREASRTAEAVEEISTEARRAQREVEGVGSSSRQAAQEVRRSGIGNAFREQLAEMAGDAQEQGASGGGSFVAGFASKLKGLGGKGGPIAAAILAVVGVGVIAGAKLADEVQKGFELQGQRDFSQAKFGFNEAQMAQAGKAAGGAFGNAWGESVQANIDTAGVAIQAGILDGDATAAQIQPVVEKLSFVSDLMGEEIPAVARAAGQMIKTGLADSSAEAFDIMTRATQKGLNLSEDLLDTITEYGTQYRKVGIDGEEAMGLISQAMEGGARDTDLAADAIKEFSLRVLDTGEETTGAFEALSGSIGLSVEEIQTAFGKGGDEANAMADKVIDALREIEDPIKRNEIGVALFGTQWEDLGGAINNMDLSKAREEMDGLKGSTQAAMDVAGGGAAASLDAAKNKISMAADEIRIKLASAFAPMATDAATWVGDHQEEILIFFAELANTAITVTAAIFDGAGAMLQFGSVTYGAGLAIIDGMIGPLLALMETLGGVLKHVPGMGWLGEAMEDTASKGRTMLDGLRDGADKMGDMGGAMFTLADKLRQGTATIDDFIAAQRDSKEGIRLTTEQTVMLTDALNKLPPGKEIKVDAPGGQSVMDLLTNMGVKVNTDNEKNIVVESPMAPATIALLEQLGIKVRTDNNKTILVTDNNTANLTATQVEALTTKINNIPASKTVMLTVEETHKLMKPGGGITYGPPQFQSTRADGAITMANGAMVGARWIDKPNQADIFQPPPEGSLMFAERETGGETYIPHAPEKRARSNAILGKTAEMFGFGLTPLKRMADGGMTDINNSIWTIVQGQFPDATLNSGTRPGDSGFHGLGAAVDVGGPMDAVARFMFDNYRDQLAQIIYGPGPNLYNVKKDLAGTGVAYSETPDQDGIYDSGTMAGHWDHVHMAAEQPLVPIGGDQPIPDAAGTAAQPIVVPTLTPDSSEDEVAAAIIAEGRLRGYSDEDIKAVLSTAKQESGLKMVHGGGGAWHGYFQQDSSYPDRDDPNGNIRGFYDRLDEKRAADQDNTDIWKDIFWLQQRPGESSAEAAVSNGRQGYLSEIQSQQESAGEQFDRIAPSIGTPGGGGTTTTTTTAGGVSTDVQQVYVTGGHLDTGGSSAPPTPAPEPEDKALARLGVAFFENGGTVGGVGNRDTEHIMAMPGEEIIQKRAAIKHRALLKAINRDELDKFADGGTVGGFGGYTTAGAEYHKGYNWMDLLGLGVGGAFAALSVVDGEGKYKGFDLGSTNVPGQEKLLEQLTKLAEKPSVVIERAEINANNPQEFFDKLRNIDPTTAEITRRNM